MTFQIRAFLPDPDSEILTGSYTIYRVQKLILLFKILSVVSARVIYAKANAALGYNTVM
jgi:hypothetical protein